MSAPAQSPLPGVMVERSLFIDGEIFREGTLEPGPIVKDAFATKVPVSVTIVLPPNLPLDQEIKLMDKIVEAGGTVKLRKTNESFGQIVDRRRSFTFMREAGSALKMWPVQAESNMPTPSYYSSEDRAALQRAYRDQEDSSSIIS